MNEPLDALRRAMQARDGTEARRLVTEMETAGTLTRADLRAAAGLPLRRGEDAGWLLAELDADRGHQDDGDDASARVNLGPRRVTRPQSATRADQADAEMERTGNAAAAAVTHAILGLTAAVTEHTAATDAAAAMVAERLERIEDTLGNAIGLIDPAFALPDLPPRVPLWARAAGLFRRTSGWRASGEEGAR